MRLLAIRNTIRALSLTDVITVARINLLMLLNKLWGRRVIILDLEETFLIPFLSPVVDVLQRPTFRLAFFAASKTNVPPVGELVVPMSRTFDYRLTRYMNVADLFISPYVGRVGPKAAIRIHLPHNQPAKFACHPKEWFQHFHAHFMIGPLHREQAEFTIAHYRLADPSMLCDVGYPKSDKLLSGYYVRREVLENLKLDPDKTTLIYAPSWEDGTSLRSFATAVLHQLTLLPEDMNIIVKLHPASCVPKEHPYYELFTGGTDWPAIVRHYEGRPNFRHLVTPDIDPLLAASDMMVTDISTVALEFLSLNKPVIYLHCPEYYERIMPSLYRDYGDSTVEYVQNDPKFNAGRHVGYLVKNVEDLASAVKFVIANPDYKLAERQAFAARLRYNPGRAAPVAARTILELLNGRMTSR